MIEARRPVVDLLALTPREREVWDECHRWAWVNGFEAGARWADDQAAVLWREAVAVVHRMAGMPEVDPDETRRQALEREARWAS